PQNRDFGDITPYGLVWGIVALLLGWSPPQTIAWSANPLLVAGGILLLFKRNAAAVGLGIAAALAGLSTWALVNEQMQLLVGYYLWQGSLITFALVALAVWWWESRPEEAVAATI